MLEDININKKINIVASEENPNFSKPRVIAFKKTRINKIGSKNIKEIKAKQPTGK